jgi:ABC-type transporter MlaC component
MMMMMMLMIVMMLMMVMKLSMYAMHLATDQARNPMYVAMDQVFGGLPMMHTHTQDAPWI